MFRRIFFTSLLALFSLALTSAPAYASSGYFATAYVVTDQGAGNIFNQLVTGVTPGSGAAQGIDQTPDGFNPPFGDFGTFIPGTDTLLLKGFEVRTFENDGSDVTNADLFFRIFPTGSPGGVFSSLTVNVPDELNMNDDKWQKVDASIDLLLNRSAGSYTMEIFLQNATNGNNTDNPISGYEFGQNPTAIFRIVPEPSSALLMSFGVCGTLMWSMFRRGRRQRR